MSPCRPLRSTRAPAILAFMLAAPAGAQEADSAIVADSYFDRFQLFTGCSPIDLEVTVQISDSDGLALTETNVARTVRSRLRAARIYSDTASDYLHVHINVLGRAFSERVSFNRSLWASETGWGVATTWQRGSVGSHGNDSRSMLGGIAEYMDEFIDDYLRVNDGACT